MSFRRRVALLAAAAVAVAVVLASALGYLLVAHQLRGQVDSQLRDRYGPFIARFKHDTAEGLAPFLSGQAPHRNPFGNVPPRPNQVQGYQQLVDSGGRVLFSRGGVTLPVSAATRALAAKGGGSFFDDANAAGVHLRILVEGVRPAAAGYPGLAVQLAQPLTEDDHLLRRLRLILLLIAVGGIALAALLGRLVADAVVAPVGRLTRAAEHVARTRDLSERIDTAGAEQVGNADEIGRLAVSFNAMLDALERSISALDASVHAQRQLVADASHELRTPITSLRTNIEILQQAPNLDPGDREQLYGEVIEQIEELTLLVGDLIDLARGDEPPAQTEDVRLDQVIREAAERARRHAGWVGCRQHAAHRARPDRAPRGSRPVGARGKQPDRQRPQVQPARRAGRDPLDGAGRSGAHGARPRPRDRRRRPAAHLRPLLPRRRGPRTAGVGAWAWRSCARWWSSMGAASSPRPLPAGAR